MIEPLITQLNARVASVADPLTHEVMWFTVWRWRDTPSAYYARPESSEPMAIDRKDRWNLATQAERNRMIGPDIVIWDDPPPFLNWP